MHLSGTIKKGSNGHLAWPAMSVVHLRGKIKPSKPGLIDWFGIVFLQERHWSVTFVAFALIPEALMIIPGILTRCETDSD